MSYLSSLLSRITPRKSRKNLQPRVRRQSLASRSDVLESRVLLASTLNGLADGRLIYSGSGVANNLTISFDGANYSFNDTGETITLLGTVAGGAGSGTNTVTFAPPAVFTQMIINNGANNDTTTINGFRDGFEGLVVQNNAGDGTDTLSINDSIGTNANRVATVGVNLAGETINLGADIFTNNLSVNVGASGAVLPINLTANSTINSGTATTAINTGAGANGLNGANSLTISAGNVQLRGEIGMNTAVSSLSATATNAAGSVQVGTTGFTTSVNATGNVAFAAGTGGVLFNSNTVTAGGDLTVTATTSSINGQATTLAGDNVSFTGSTSGAQNLFINATAGNYSTGGNVALTGTATLNATATGTIDLNGSTSAAGGVTLTAPTITAAAGIQSSGGSVDVNGNITFDGAGAVTVFANTAGTIDFSGSITGNGANLALQQANIVAIGGAVTNVGQFSIAKAIAGTIATATVNNVTAGSIAITATGINNRGDLLATTGPVSLTGAVTLDGADTTNTITSGTGQNVTITGAVNDGTAGTHTLELIATGSGAVQTTAGGIGLTTRLQTLVASGSTVNLNGVGVVNNVTVRGGVVNFVGGAGSITSSSGTGGMFFVTRTYGSTLEVYNVATAPPSANMTVDTTDLAALSGFAGLVFGDFGGTVNVISDGLAGTSLALTHPVTEFAGSVVNVNEALAQAGNTLQFNVDTTLNLNAPATGTGTVNIFKAISPGTLTVNGSIGGNGWGASALGVIGGAGVETVHFTGEVGGVITSFTAFGNLENVTKAGTSALTAQGDVFINGNYSGAGLQSTTGDILVTGNVNATGALSFIVPAGKNLQINGTTTAGGNISVTGRNGALNAASFLGNVTTTGSFGITSSGASTANFVSLVGAVQASSLVVRANQINLANNLTATAGSVHLLGTVDLLNNVVMTSSGLAPHFVRVDGTINGNFNLTSNSGLGQTHFVGAIGNIIPLSNLTVDAGGYNYIYQSITATGTVDWFSGDSANAGGDVINVLAGKTITAGIVIALEADSVIVNAVTQLFAPIEIVINNGAP